jgi:hypothetical protein
VPTALPPTPPHGTAHPITKVVVEVSEQMATSIAIITKEDVEQFLIKPRTREEEHMLREFMDDSCGHNCGDGDTTLHDAHLMAWRAHQLMMGRLVPLRVKDEDITLATRRRGADARFRCAFKTINMLCSVLHPTLVTDSYKEALVLHGTLAHMPF